MIIKAFTLATDFSIKPFATVLFRLTKDIFVSTATDQSFVRVLIFWTTHSFRSNLTRSIASLSMLCPTKQQVFPTWNSAALNPLTNRINSWIPWLFMQPYAMRSVPLFRDDILKKTVNKDILKTLVIFSQDTAISDNCGGCNKPCFSMTRMRNCTKFWKEYDF